MNKSTIIRYSEAFKLEVVKDYEESDLTREEIRLKYGVKGYSTIASWVKKYGSPAAQNRKIRIEMPNEIDELKALKKEIKELKQMLADAHIRNVTNENFLFFAAERLGMTVEELKKKIGTEL